MSSAGADQYDAFLSYNQKADRDLAQVLFAELGKFAKPLFRARSLRAFRDDDSLAANPDLWSSIEDALSKTRRFVLLASRGSARSYWVNKEVTWWLENRSPSTLLIVVTDGLLPWEPAARTAPHELALPPALLPYPGNEPRAVDLRSLRRAPKIDRADPVLIDAVADLYAGISDKPKDLVFGEHVRHRKRRLRLAVGAVVALSVLLVLAVVAAGLAVVARQRAVDEARVATARQTAALAVANIENRMDLAQLLAVAAYRIDESPQTRSALHQVTMASPHLVRYVPMRDRVFALASARTGEYAVAGTEGGELVRWRAADDAMESVRLDHSAILSVVTDDAGDTIVAASASTLGIWRVGQPLVTLPIRAFTESTFTALWKPLAISPSGDTVAVVDHTESARDVIRVFTTKGEEITRLDDRAVSIGLPDDSDLLVGGSSGEWRTISLATGEGSASGGDLMTPGDAYFCCAYDRDNRNFVWAKFGEANLVPLGPDADQTVFRSTPVPVDSPSVYAVDDSTRRVALAGGGELYVGDLPDEATPVRSERLLGAGPVDALTFLGSPDRLVSASGRSLILWDLTQSSRAVVASPLDAPTTSLAGEPPNIAVGPGQGHFAVANGHGVVISAPGAPFPDYLAEEPPVSDPMPVWSADGDSLIVLGDKEDEDGAVVVDRDGGGRDWAGPSTRHGDDVSPAVLAARLTPDGRVVLVNEHGDVQVRDAATGRVTKEVASGLDEELAPPFALRENVAAVSEDGSVAAIVLPGRQVVRVVDVRTGAATEVPGGRARVVTFLADRLLVGKSTHDLEVWDTRGTHRYRTIAGDADYAQAITGIPGSRLVARLTEQGVVRLWYTDTGQLLGSFALPDSGSGAESWSMTSLAATRDGSELISATAGGTILRWELRPSSWAAISCAVAGRSLSTAEWQEYVGDADVPAGVC